MTKQIHTVSTDALGTLGTIIDETAGRDAIHLAAEPAVAGQDLFPGDHIGRLSDGRWGHLDRANCVGIVDPFLPSKVREGQWFWLVVYPRTITSLRHVWEHPAFPQSAIEAPPADERAVAEKWLRDYAAEIDEGFGTLIDAARHFVDTGDYFYGAATNDDGFVYHGKFEGESTHPDFWAHFQVYTGQIVPADKQHSFFTCSC